GCASLDALIEEVIPRSIRAPGPAGSPNLAGLPEPASERDMLVELADLASRNRVARSLIGCGYHGTITPPVLQRNVLETP
ncbi:hypothetical protein, partial [Pseudomonas aeruginosa]|uniref:hypothetical protein n=1 Tax=Pseudomonas aeruginosa TaxID=287 RepID=UPI002F92AD3C